MKNNIICFSLFLFLGFVNYSNAQNQFENNEALKKDSLLQKIDSLTKKIETLDTKFSQMQKDIALRKSETDAIFSIFDTESTESTDFESRSRKKRVDALLDALKKRPGELRFNGAATSVIQGTGKKTDWDFFGTGTFDIYAHTMLGKKLILFFDLQAIGGNGLDAFYETFSGINGNSGSTQSRDGLDRLTILEGWGEFKLFKKVLTLTVGKIDLTNYFDNNASANDETMQFISGSFINNSAFAVPTNTPGVCLQTTFYKRYHLQIGLASTQNSGDQLFRKFYRIVSMGWTFAPESDFELDMSGYVYQHPEAPKSFGWGLSFNKIFFENYNVFGRYGQNEKETNKIAPVHASWSVGLRFVKTFFSYPLAIGLAFGENKAYDKTMKIEKISEIYIRYQLNKWVFLSPHFQYLWNAKGTGKQLYFASIRTHFNF